MRNIFIKTLIIISLLLPSVALGSDGALRFADLLKASPAIAASTTQEFVNKMLPGSIVNINGIEYEIRYFSFEDVTGNLPANIKFADYIKNNHLLEAESIISEPITGLKFQAFDFRKYNLNDGVYFSMALREVKKGW